LYALRSTEKGSYRPELHGSNPQMFPAGSRDSTPACCRLEETQTTRKFAATLPRNTLTNAPARSPTLNPDKRAPRSERFRVWPMPSHFCPSLVVELMRIGTTAAIRGSFRVSGFIAPIDTIRRDALRIFPSHLAPTRSPVESPLRCSLCSESPKNIRPRSPRSGRPQKHNLPGIRVGALWGLEQRTRWKGEPCLFSDVAAIAGVVLDPAALCPEQVQTQNAPKANLQGIHAGGDSPKPPPTFSAI
jgi:hypothetical protein